MNYCLHGAKKTKYEFGEEGVCRVNISIKTQISIAKIINIPQMKRMILFAANVFSANFPKNLANPQNVKIINIVINAHQLLVMCRVFNPTQFCTHFCTIKFNPQTLTQGTRAGQKNGLKGAQNHISSTKIVILHL